MPRVSRPKEMQEEVVEPAPEIVEEIDDLEEEIDEVDVEDDMSPANSIEDLPSDQILWPNGPTAGHVKEWKAQYGDVFITSFNYDTHVAWRTLGRLEYKGILKTLERIAQANEISETELELLQEEIISSTCMLFPDMKDKEFDDELAGLPAIVSQQVLEASGFVSLETRQL